MSRRRRRRASGTLPNAFASAPWTKAHYPAGCYSNVVSFSFRIELEREEDGRWIAEISDLPGVLCSSRPALALRVTRLEHGEAPADLANVSFRAA